MKLFCNITNYQNNPHYDLGFVSIVLLGTNDIRSLLIFYLTFYGSKVINSSKCIPLKIWFDNFKMLLYNFENFAFTIFTKC